MKKKNIVKDNRYFNQIIDNNEFLKSNYFIIYMLKTNEPESKFGIATGKKLGNAVIRNKLKRRYRSLVDENKLLFPKGFDYIIMVKKASLQASFKEINDSIKEIFKKE